MRDTTRRQEENSLLVSYSLGLGDLRLINLHVLGLPLALSFCFGFQRIVLLGF